MTPEERARALLEQIRSTYGSGAVDLLTAALRDARREGAEAFQKRAATRLANTKMREAAAMIRALPLETEG